ncbi:MAG: hypothetical protein WKF40_01225 [Thermoleophilaceae bacterium]
MRGRLGLRREEPDPFGERERPLLEDACDPERRGRSSGSSSSSSSSSSEA